MNMDVGRHGSGPTGVGALLVFGLAVLPGCVSTGAKKGVPEQAPTGPVAQVQSLWQGRIVSTRDPVHQGAPLPGVAGRVYLFGQDFGTGLKAKGKLLVDLYESDRTGPDGQPRLLEHYEFPDEVLQRLLRKDSIIGWGYTVFLPWPEYNPEIKHVQLKVCFAPEQGTSTYEQPHQLTVRNDQAPLPPAVVERVVPAIAEDVNQTGAKIPIPVPVTNAVAPNNRNDQAPAPPAVVERVVPAIAEDVNQTGAKIPIPVPVTNAVAPKND